MTITLNMIQDLAKEFQIKFSITIENEYISYNFGKIKWYVVPQTIFSLEDYIGVCKRLAATYPEKVLK